MNFKNSLELYKRFHYQLVDIPVDEWEYLEKSIIRFRTIKKGSFFCRQGEKSDLTSFVSQGLFEASYVNDKNNTVIRRFYEGPVGMAPYQSLIKNEPSEISLIALEDSFLIELNYSDIKSCLLYTSPSPRDRG